MILTNSKPFKRLKNNRISSRYWTRVAENYGPATWQNCKRGTLWDCMWVPQHRVQKRILSGTIRVNILGFDGQHLSETKQNNKKNKWKRKIPRICRNLSIFFCLNILRSSLFFWYLFFFFNLLPLFVFFLFFFFVVFLMDFGCVYGLLGLLVGFHVCLPKRL